MSYSFSSYPVVSNDTEIQQLRTRIMSYIQARVCTGERYSETKLAREAGVAQQTVNDLLRGKTASVTRLTRTKLIDFLENNPPSSAASNTTILGPAAALMMIRRTSPPVPSPLSVEGPHPLATWLVRAPEQQQVLAPGPVPIQTRSAQQPPSSE
jgi:DNA-binding Xre family transcriptional regulator